MTDTIGLDGARVLILEDDFYLASELQAALVAVGAIVIGPFADERQARRAVETERADCALVDVNLGHGPDFNLPQALVDHRIPFAFVTGYDMEAMPPRYRSVPQLNKPVDSRRVVELTQRLLTVTPV